MGEIDLKKIIFVVGLHRSGTTILTDILASHDDVTGLSLETAPANEGQHMQTLYPTDIDCGGMGNFALNKDAHLTEEEERREVYRRQILKEWWRNRDKDRNVIVEKSPRHLLMVRFLYSLFPEAKFVVTMRHPIPVSYSTKKFCRWPFRPFKQAPLFHLMRNWVSGYNTWRSDCTYINFEDYREVKYEEFAERTEHVIAELLNFIGLSSDGVSEEKLRSVGNRNEKYMAKWENLKKGRFGYMYFRVLRSFFSKKLYPYNYSL